jgi:hypothetical protein
MRAAAIASLLLVTGLMAGCWMKLYPPIAYLERTAPIYPDARPDDCKITVLNAPPNEPFDVFGHIVAYAGAEEMAERMEMLIKKNACEAGADAIVLLPVQKGTHYNTEAMYPDWLVENGEGQGRRMAHWTDKRYTVSQRAVTLVFKATATQTAEQKKPES